MNRESAVGYQLKSDPSVKWNPVGFVGSCLKRTPLGTCPDDWIWIPEPAEPVLVEDELEELRQKYPMTTAEYAELLARAATELRRLRAEKDHRERRMDCWALADRYLHALHRLLTPDDIWAALIESGDDPQYFGLVQITQHHGKNRYFQRHLLDEARITDALIKKEMQSLVATLNKSP
jgi:hypothetical protein